MELGKTGVAQTIVDEERSIGGKLNCRICIRGEVIEALRLTSYVNRLPHTPVLQGHKFIRKSNRAVKSTSDFAGRNKITGTLRSINDRSER